MEEDEEEEHHQINSSFRRRNKSSIVGNISCCFSGATPNYTQRQHHRRASLDGSIPFSSPISSSSSSSHRRSTSAWFKSMTNDIPEIKGRCRNFMISRMGRHRRHSSADFSYDPLSYALNFDDDAPSSSEASIMNFSSRLPLSPPAARTKTRTTPFDHHLPRSLPIPQPISPTEEEDPERSKIGAGNGDLRRGFEALSVSMKEMKVVAGQRRNINTDDHEMSGGGKE